MSKCRPMIALLAGFMAASSLLLADTRQEWSQPTKKWSHGPVRCLLTPEEEKQFKSLKTEEEIARFIKEFWEKRDPTPGTPENEFEDLFWKRVAEADKRFVQTTESGAVSDRGQVFILLGMPTRTDTGKNVDWIYENVPNVNPPNFTVLFHSVPAGNLLQLSKKEFEEMISANEFLRGLGPKAKEIYAPPPVVAEALPSVQETAAPPEAATEEAKILDSLAGSDLLPSAIPLQARVDLYQATKGDSFAVVTLALSRSDAGAGSPVGFARFVPDAAEAKRVTLAAADSFAPAEPENQDPAGSSLLFQGGAGLHPGHYTVFAGLRDPQSGKVGVVKQSLDVPKYEGADLVLSTVVLARTLEGPKAPPAVGEGKKPPYFLGSFRVVPSLDGVFKQGSDLAWYYQIYNAASDPSTGKPNLTIEYNFLLKQTSKEHPEGEFRPVTAPQVERNRPSQIAAFSFQLVKPHPGKKDGWVEGDYRLAIKVTDEVSGKSTTRELGFKVIP
jgi:GWxTD domain-containing protein